MLLTVLGHEFNLKDRVTIDDSKRPAHGGYCVVRGGILKPGDQAVAIREIMSDGNSSVESFQKVFTRYHALTKQIHKCTSRLSLKNFVSGLG